MSFTINIYYKGENVLDDALAIVGSQAKDSKDIVERWV